MSNCKNCGTEVDGYFCRNCGHPVEQSNTQEEPISMDVLNAEPPKKKGKISSVIGLLLMAICDAVAVFMLFKGIFRTTDMTFTEQLVDTIGAAALVLMLGIWFFGLVKWIVFSVPKTFRWSIRIANAIIPLSCFVFVAEIMFVIWLTLIPISLYSVALAPMAALVSFFMTNRAAAYALPLAILALVAAGGATYFLVSRVIKKHFAKQ